MRDRFLNNRSNAVDVVIPMRYAPNSFEKFLESYYADVPINRLIIGNAGISSNLLEILNRFPRLSIVDHTQIKSMGFSLQLLINMVETEWFVYFHSDVSIPEGWFNEMSKYKKQYDWFECRKVDPQGKEQKTFDKQIKKLRAYSGSQMGKSKIFKNIQQVDDTVILFRAEDLFFQQEIEKHGYHYGKVTSTFHYHNLEQHPIGDRKLILFAGFKETIKYLSPKLNYNRYKLLSMISKLISMNEWSKEYWIDWVTKNNPEWLPIMNEILNNHKKIFLLVSLIHKLKLGKNTKTISLFMSFLRILLLKNEKKFS